MRKIEKLFSVIFLVLVFSFTVAFVHSNSEPVSISLGVLTIVEYPMAVWIVGAFVLGGLLGLILGRNWLQNLKSRMEIKDLTKKLTRANRLIKDLR